MRHAVEHPNTDGAKGSTLPPPRWSVVEVDEVAMPHNEKFVRRTIADIATELGKEPADVLLDLALDEDLRTVFRYVNKSRAWEDAVAHGQSHPAMIIGVSDGGAHLDRDDGSDWSTAFLAFWVRDRKLWSLEEGIRQLTQVPAALLGFEGRGALLPGYWADAFIFDPDTIELESKKQVKDFPGGEARYSARPRGICLDDRQRRAHRAQRRGAHRQPPRTRRATRGGLTSRRGAIDVASRHELVDQPPDEAVDLVADEPDVLDGLARRVG